MHTRIFIYKARKPWTQSGKTLQTVQTKKGPAERWVSTAPKQIDAKKLKSPAEITPPSAVKQKLKELIETHDILNDEFSNFGLRFETAIRQIGDAVGASKHNPDRDDERDFPEYGTPEYDNLPLRQGTSAYAINRHPLGFLNRLIDRAFDYDHIYLVEGTFVEDDDLDDHEVVIDAAKVVERLR